MTAIHLHKLLLERTWNWKCRGYGGAYHSVFFFLFPMQSFRHTMPDHTICTNVVATYVLFTK